MPSTVFYRFKSSTETKRVTFEGTGINVFDLKREIINQVGLGDGTDFDFYIYTEDMEEYDDDTTIVPRSTTVIARRAPAARPGHGKASRYITGKNPVQAKNQYRTENRGPEGTGQGDTATAVSAAAAKMENAETEAEKLAAMFDAENWSAQQANLKNMKSAQGKPNYRGREVRVPDHPPPPSYTCHRCHVKGHWIQACPTNDDPNFVRKPQIHRTTGIPKSFLKEVKKPVADTNDGFSDDRPASYMMTADGKYVEQVPDTAAWERHLARTNQVVEKKKEADPRADQIRARGLECPIDHVLFISPSKTPCCDITYCQQCIEDAVCDNDLTCPNCKKQCLVEDILPNEEMKQKIKEWEEEVKKEEEEAKKAAEEKAAEEANEAEEKAKEESETKPEETDETSTKDHASPTSAEGDDTSDQKNAKKRTAEDELKNPRIPTEPAAMRRQRSEETPEEAQVALFKKQMQELADGTFKLPTFTQQPMHTAAPMMGMQQPFAGGMMMQPQWGGMGYGMGQGMGQAMGQGMGQGMMMGGMGNDFNMQNMQQYQNFGGFGGYNGGGAGYGQQPFNNNNQFGGFGGGPQQLQNFGGGVGTGGQLYPQQGGGGEDSAYMRGPVNPGRQNRQNRQGRLRPSDYKELS